jgi:hypothetical protein
LSGSKKYRRPVWLGYAVAALLCGIFILIYSQFAHGVRSIYMDSMWLYPLAAGLVVTLMVWRQPKLKRSRSGRRFVRFVNGAAALLTTGSLLKGVVAIAGTDSILIWPYYLLGFALVFAAGLTAVRLGKRSVHR